MYETQTTTVEPPRVRVALGHTKNLGNFESLRVDIAIEASARVGETVSSLVDRVYAETEKQLLAKLNEAESDA